MSTKTKTEQKAGAIELPNFVSSGHESDWWASKEGRDYLHAQIQQAEKNQTPSSRDSATGTESTCGGRAHGIDKYQDSCG
jgi:hypothetical protein